VSTRAPGILGASGNAKLERAGSNPRIRSRNSAEQKRSFLRSSNQSGRAPRVRIFVRSCTKTFTVGILRKIGCGEIFAPVERVDLFAGEKSVFALEADLDLCAREYFFVNRSAFALAAERVASNEVQGAIEIKEEEQMSQRKVSFILAALAALLLTLPFSARSDNTVLPKALVNMSVELNHAAALGGTELKPGNYLVRADSVKVTLSRGNKAIAEAPVQWKDEAGKAGYSSIVTESNKIKEIHFFGKTKYVEITQ
jgi:hypothetical protein